METTELIVLASDDGAPIGSAPKLASHSAHTPLHLAFSCHVFDGEGRMLMTRRALSKLTWPGVWTNSFCGHPAPGEQLAAAVRRRAQHELGLELGDISPLLPDFRYTAVDPSGIVENEICPVVWARAASHVQPNPDEVVEHVWASTREIAAAVRAAPWAVSPWFAMQLEQLSTAKDSPWRS